MEWRGDLVLWRGAVSTLLVTMGVLIGGCDPCSGLGSCAAPLVRYEGEIVRGGGVGLPSLPAETVSVKFVPSGGVALEDTQLIARTDEEGKFRLEGNAKAEGDVVGDLWIYPPSPVPPIRVQDVRMKTTRARGELHALKRWKVPYPYLGYQFYLFYRATGKPATGIEVEFRRTGGIALDSDTLRVKSDPRGFVILRPEKIGGYGELEGELDIHLLPPRQPYVLHGLKLRTFTEERYDSIIPVGIGDRLPYVVILVTASTGEAVPNAEVEFRRTGGVPIYPDRFVGHTNAGGGIRIDPVPLSSGVVIGDLIVRPAGSAHEFTIGDVRLNTIGDDRPDIFFGYLGVPGL